MTSFANDAQQRGQIAELERQIAVTQEDAAAAWDKCEERRLAQEAAEHRAATAEARVNSLRDELERSRRNAANWAAEKGEETKRADVAQSALQETLAREAGKDAALAFYRDAWGFKTNKRYGGLEWHPKEELLDDCGNRAKEALSATPSTRTAALIRAGEAACEETAEDYRSFNTDRRRYYATVMARRKACAAVLDIEKEKGDGLQDEEAGEAGIDPAGWAAMTDAHKIARCVRGCTTDAQYQELTANIEAALSAATKRAEEMESLAQAASDDAERAIQRAKAAEAALASANALVDWVRVNKCWFPKRDREHVESLLADMGKGDGG